MKFVIATLATLACLLAIPSFATSGVVSSAVSAAVSTALATAASTPDSDLVANQGTVPIGGSVTVKNGTNRPIIVTASIGGAAGEPFILAPGETREVNVPNDPALIGLTLTIKGTSLSIGANVGFIKTWKIVA